jgi:predicted translin family RNA/ssDNA-binding protein
MGTLTIGDHEYEIDSLTDKQKKMVVRIESLKDQIEELNFLVNGYVNTLKSELQESEEGD